MPCNAKRFQKRELWIFRILAIGLMAAALAGLSQAQQAPASPAPSGSHQPPNAKSFSTPDDAAAALFAAARRNDEAELLVILGPDAKQIIEWSDDPNERRARHEHFAEKYDQMHRLLHEPDGTVALYIGAENWPMPIPLVEYKGAWYFDVDLGKQEIRYRRIGRNEIEALEVCHALLDAEQEYYAQAHAYTDKFISTGQSHDGLYWKAADSATKSPIGPFLAHAGVNSSSGSGGEPFHGYYYRIVLQGGSGTGASGGGAAAKAGGLAILAFPAEYGSSGVMTFLMDQNGNAREKDLGSSTATSANQIASYSPDDTWKKVE